MSMTSIATTRIHQRFTEDQLRTLGYLVKSLRENSHGEDTPTRLPLYDAVQILSKAGLNTVMCAKGEVDLVIESIHSDYIHEDDEYLYLFDTGEFVEAYAYELDSSAGKQVTVIYVSDDMAVRLEFKESDGICSAMVTAKSATPEGLISIVHAWEDEDITKAVDITMTLISPFPKACQQRALSSIKSRLCRVVVQACDLAEA